MNWVNFDTSINKNIHSILLRYTPFLCIILRSFNHNLVFPLYNNIYYSIDKLQFLDNCKTNITSMTNEIKKMSKF